MVGFARKPWQRDPRIGVLVLVAGACIVAFVALGIMTALAPGLIRCDVAMSAQIRSLCVSAVEPLARAASFIGGVWPMTALTLIVAGWLLVRRRRTSALMLVVAMAGSVGLDQLAKIIFHRMRPLAANALIPLPDSYSFPSGHALSSFVFFGCIALFVLFSDTVLGRKIVAAVLCALAAGAIAFSRVLLGVHYLGDIVGGWMLGAAWLALVTLVTLRWAASSKAARPGGLSEAES